MSEKDSGFGRRKFLTRSGATVAGLTLGATYSATATPGRVQHLETDLNSPITREQIDQARTRALTAFAEQSGASSDVVGRAALEDNHDPIVAFLTVVDSNGVFREFVATADDETSAKKGRKRVRQQASTYEDSDLSTQSVSTQSTSWDWFYSHTSWSYSDPHGEVESEAELYKLQDDGDSSQDGFAIRHNFKTTPGYKKYNSDWHNYEGFSKQDWSQNSIGGVGAINDIGPESKKSGSQTVYPTLTLQSTDLNWNFSQGDVTLNPTATSDELQNGYAEWKQTYNNTDAENADQVMQPGTAAHTDQHSSGTYDLAKVTAEETFSTVACTSLGCAEDYETLTEAKTMQVEYTSDGVMGDTK